MASQSSLEARVAHVEGIIEEILAPLTSIENLLGRLEDRIDALEARMQMNFQWTIGIVLGVLIPMWVTIILAILLRT